MPIYITKKEVLHTYPDGEQRFLKLSCSIKDYHKNGKIYFVNMHTYLLTLVDGVLNEYDDDLVHNKASGKLTVSPVVSLPNPHDIDTVEVHEVMRKSLNMAINEHFDIECDYPMFDPHSEFDKVCFHKSKLGYKWCKDTESFLQSFTLAA